MAPPLFAAGLEFCYVASDADLTDTNGVGHISLGYSNGVAINLVGGYPERTDALKMWKLDRKPISEYEVKRLFPHLFK